MTTVPRDDVADIRRLLTETYAYLMSTYDATEYAALYSDDVLWCPSHAPEQTSPAGIQAAVQRHFDTYSTKIDPMPEHIAVDGDLAYATGRINGVLTPRAGGELQNLHIRVFWLLRRERGDWKIHRQICKETAG